MTWHFKGLFRRFLEAPDAGEFGEVAPRGRGRIRYNDVSKTFDFSVDGGDFVPVATGCSQPLAAVATIAALSALDDSRFTDGVTLAVASVIDQFSLLKASTRAVDGITVVATLSGVGRWIRRELPSSEWAARDTWYIDADGGDDENDGGSPAAPIRSHAELRRRIGKLVISQYTFVYLSGTFDERFVVDFLTDAELGALLYVGTRTQIAAEVIAGATPHSDTGTRAFGELTFGADVSSLVGTMLVPTNGAAADAVAWHCAPGSAGASSALTGTFITAINTSTFPGVGDTIGFYELTRIVGGIDLAPTSFVGFFDVHVEGDSTFRGGVENSASIGRSRWDGRVYAMGRSGFQGSTAGDEGVSFAAQFAGSHFRGSLFALEGGLLLTQNCTMAGTGSLKVLAGAQYGVSLSMGMVGQPGAEPLLEVEGYMRVVGGAAVSWTTYGDEATCLRVQSGGVLRLTGSAWGRDIASGGTGKAIEVRAGSMMAYYPGNAPDFAPNTNILVGGTPEILADLPQTNAANFAAIVIDA